MRSQHPEYPKYKTKQLVVQAAPQPVLASRPTTPTQSQSEHNNTKKTRKTNPSRKPSTKPWPLFITGLSWLRTKEDKGIGDTVKHALGYMGGSQFEWVMKRLGIDCGCGSRQEWLNSMYPYDGTI